MRADRQRERLCEKIRTHKRDGMSGRPNVRRTEMRKKEYPNPDPKGA